MTLEQAFIAALTLGGSVLGWLARELLSSVQKLRADLSALETKIGTDYVRYDRLQDVMRPVTEKLTRIEEILSHKVDK